jgi:hypothetical protein
MAQRPWAIDSLIIYDDDNLRSRLIGGMGLPTASAVFSARYGRRPAIGGLSRPEHRVVLETYFKYATAAARKAARTDLLQHLNPELEQTVRLTAVDEVIPGVARDGVLLAMGPWDVYCDDDGDWHVRDLLRPDDFEADLTGGWQIGEDGGLQLYEATTNLVTNPSGEIGTTGWASFGNNTVERSSDRAKFGNHSLKCSYVDNANAVAYYGITLTAAAHTASVWIWVPSSYSGTDIELWMSNFSDIGGPGVNQVTANVDMGIRDEWQRVTVTGTPAAGDLSGQIYIRDNGGMSSGDYVYIDGILCEAKAYATAYCDGSLGPGHSWSGDPHESTSSRTGAECNLDDHAAELVNDQMTICGWCVIGTLPSSTGIRARLIDLIGADNDSRIQVAFFNSNKLSLYVDGDWRVSEIGSGSLSFGDEIFWCATVDFDEDEYSLFMVEADGTLYTDSDDTSLSTPVVTQGNLGSANDTVGRINGVLDDVLILNRVLSASEKAAWYAHGRGVLNARRLDVLCEAAMPWAPGGITTDLGVVATLAVDKEVRWRQRDGDVHFWRVYDDTGEATVEVDSDDDVYPVFRFTPKTAKTGDYAYRRWVPVIWTADAPFTNYPYMLGTFDTAALVSASKAQSDGDDWRVLVDGAETDRWFGDSGTSQFNQTATKTWTNLSFQAGQQVTLEAAIGSGDTVDSIDVNEDISGFPSAGILLLDNGSNTEAFTYTGKNDAERRFTGVTRAAKGTTARAFSANDDVYWIQHDVWITYGNASVSAPTQDDDYKPVFDLASSTNTSWVYEEFGEDDGLRSGAWTCPEGVKTPGGTAAGYGGNQATHTDLWVEIGLFVIDTLSAIRFYLYNPCGIANANFTNGEKRSDDKTKWVGEVQSSSNGTSWTTEYSIPAPSVNSTWESWSRNEALTSGATYAAIMCRMSSGWPQCELEAADCTLTLDSSNTPTHEIGDELGNYNLDCTIENETTGDSVEIAMTMGLDETLEVDTYHKTITLLADGTSQMQALTLVGGARRDWLRLVDGENDLSYSDTGTEELQIDILWDRRLFE